MKGTDVWARFKRSLSNIYQDNDLNNKTIVANQISENHLAMISKRDQVYYLEYFYNSHRLDSNPLLAEKGDKRLEKNISVTPSFIKKGAEDNQVIFGLPR